MKLKKEIGEILDFLKKEGHGRRLIEQKLGYTEKSIDQSYNRGGTEELLTRLKLYKEYVLLLNATIGKRGTDEDQPIEINLAALHQETKVIAATQKALVEMILVLAAKSGQKKADYNKYVEILKKYKLEGILT